MRIIISLLSARPHKLKSVIDNIFGTSSNTYVLVSYSGEKVEFERSTRLAINYFGLDDPPGKNFCELVKETVIIAKKTFQGEDADICSFWCDDFIAEQGWENALLLASTYQPEKDYIGVNPCTNFSNSYIHSFWYHVPLFFCSFAYLRDVLNNEILSTTYTRFFCDSDNSQLAQLLNRYQYVENCIIRHIHHLDGGREKDALDSKWDASTEIDYEIYKGRRRLMMDVFIPSVFSTQSFDWKQSSLPVAVLDTVNKLGCTGVIETGTAEGCGSTRFFAKLLPNLPVHSIEAVYFCYEDAKNSLASFPNVNLYHGFSLDYMMAEMQPGMEPFYDMVPADNLLERAVSTVERPFFFLDTPVAHLEYQKILDICKDKTFAILLNAKNTSTNVPLPTLYHLGNWKIVSNKEILP